MRVARIPVSWHLMRQALGLPDDTELCGARVEPDMWQTVELTVVHPDLRDVTLTDGELPPVATPTMKRQDPVVLVEWGQK